MLLSVLGLLGVAGRGVGLRQAVIVAPNLQKESGVTATDSHPETRPAHPGTAQSAACTKPEQTYLVSPLFTAS
jgi:hypothetical protein